ncbi:MAG: M48 family metalloprotease, partial [Gemmatimonadaceae bacterium]|nr:M48 family metalloprotease [Gemmatimonadaceae bacterium]
RHGVEQMVKRQRGQLAVTVGCWLTDACNSGAAQAAIQVGGSALFARYGRTDEREADAAAVATLARAGMDPRAVPRMLAQLQRAEGRDPTLVDAFLGSHPLTAERVARTTALADSTLRAQSSDPDAAARDDRDMRDSTRGLEQGVRTGADADFSAFVAAVRALPAPPAARPRRGDPP